MLLTFDSYYLDSNNKLLFCKDLLVYTGQEAIEVACIIAPWGEWMRVRARTPMKNRSNRIDEEAVNGMGHSSHRSFDRHGHSLRSVTLECDRALDDTQVV